MAEWQAGLCDCGNELGMCCLGLFCPCAALFINAENMNRSGLLYVILFLWLNCLSLLVFRIEVKKEYGIEVNY